MNSDEKNIKGKDVTDMEIGASGMQIEIKDLSHLKEGAIKILQNVLNKNSKGALIICLSGDLGAGKTTFVQTCASLLGIEERITSPTFVIMKKYKLNEGEVLGEVAPKLDLKQYKNLIHIDAYRLGGERDLESLRFMDFVKDKANIIFIEWPERLLGAINSLKAGELGDLGAIVFNINIDHKNDGVRIFSISR